MSDTPEAGPATPVTPRPAAAIVLLRGHEPSDEPSGGAEAFVEVFMVRRHVRNEFAPDVFVFPGGSVTPEDREAELLPDLCAPVGEGATTLGSGFRAAALRECFEEAGVLLARRGARALAITDEDTGRFATYRAALQAHAVGIAAVAKDEGLTLATDALLHWAHWITPAAWSMRFDTHFFLAAMPAAQEAAHDRLETTAGVWVTPEDALARFERGEFPLVFATVHQLRELRGLPGVAEALRRFAGTTPKTILPRIVERGGTNVILLPGEE